MRLPRDVSGANLVSALRKLGYYTTRQKGLAHSCNDGTDGQHHEVIPNHNPIRTGTLHSILKSIAAHHKMSVEDLISTLRL